MTMLHKALEDAKRNERHNTVAETRYWLNQYKLIAEQALAAQRRIEELEAQLMQMRGRELKLQMALNTPAAQRPVAEPHKWVGLEREIAAAVLGHCYGHDGVSDDMIERTTEVIKAKLKEKNA